MKKVFQLTSISLALLLVGALPIQAENTGAMPNIGKSPDSLWNDFFVQHVWEQTERPLHVGNVLRTVFFIKNEARNVNSDGSVSDSLFFENRVGVRNLSRQEIIDGPSKSETGPQAGKWKIFKAKSSGVETGFFIEDSTGAKYIVKLDSQAFPELQSSVEAISSKLFHALGYHVPEYDVVKFKKSDLTIAEGLTYYDDTGFKVPFDRNALDAVLANAAIDRNGYYRASASRLISGRILGPTKLTGRRFRDVDDRINHEDRREFRGLRVFCSWLNHFDMRDGNTLDVMNSTETGWEVKHYLIDFGMTLGAFRGHEKYPETGHEHVVDLPEITKSLLSLGFYKRPWEPVERVNPHIGYFTNRDFDPGKWKTHFPNYAFQRMTKADAKWAAQILSNITDEHISAAVDAGKITSARAAQELKDKLSERRDIIVRYWLSK